MMDIEALMFCVSDRESLKSCGRFLWTRTNGDSIEGWDDPSIESDASILLILDDFLICSLSFKFRY